MLSACETTTDTTPIAPVSTPASRPAPIPTVTATPGLSVNQRVKLALDLLGQGEAAKAKAEVDAILAERPEHVLAKDLLAQILGDPKVLLGAESFPYKVQPGETLSSLADKFLNDRYKFYILARYNGIAVPDAPEVGNTIQIPGAPRAGKAARPRPAPTTKPAPAKPAPATAAPARNPARASQLRGQALEQMNAGRISPAVRLLQQALSLDPGNALIQRDLDRARRIQNGVR
jgi:hypothetical protein